MPAPDRRRPASGSAAGRRGSPMLRLRIGLLAIAMVLSVFGARLLQLQGLDAESYAEMAAAEGARTVVLPADRGDILDRNGQPLADSVSGMMVVADPSQTRDKAPEIATFLSDRLDIDYFDTLKRLRTTGEGDRFQYLARRVPSTLALRTVAEAKTLGYDGLDTRRDPIRDYPAHDVLANLVGFLGTPDPHKGEQPLAGFELAFNRQLAGQDGEASYQVGGGNVIPLPENTLVKPVDGKDLRTTLDLDLSFYALRVLRQAVDSSGGLSGTAVVIDTRTGQVLAIADYPTFDAADPLASKKRDLGARSMSDSYEPGSVEKVLTMAALLDAGLVTPRTQVFVPPELPRGDTVIHDWFTHDSLRLTLAGVIAQSSNIGTVLAADQMGPRELRGYLRDFGMGQRTDVGVLGETRGTLPSGTALTPGVKDRMAFGQSMSVNALQMAAGVNTIANDGVYVSPSLILGSARTDEGRLVGSDHAVTRRVVSPQAARQTMKMMERVVDPATGTAPYAQVPGYRVAGKTGTAQRVGPGCSCYDGSHTVSFGGFAPADDPRLTVYVVVQRPTNGGGGGSIAGPAFGKIMGFALHRYGIAPTGTPPSHLPVTWTR